MNQRVKRILCGLLIAFCCASIPTILVSADEIEEARVDESEDDTSCNAIDVWSDSKLRRYAEDNILYYDDQFECEVEPPEEDCLSVYDPDDSEPITIEGGGYARLKQAVRDYHETAMQAQKDYGTPWEMVFAQMQKESSTGTTGIAIQGATNNWLGITGSGDAGTWVSPKGRKWAKFSSVGASITAWAGPKVLRNPKGYYNSTFKYLSLENYDLNAFIRAVVEIYAPKSDGNDPASYSNTVIGLINGPIKEVREELGLPSSEEWARENNIDAANMTGNSSGDNPGNDNTEESITECSTGDGGGDEDPVVVGDYAFPLIGAKKSNYLNPGGNAGQSVLSRLPCGSGNCHHDYNAVDLGLRKKLVNGTEYTSANFPQYSFSDMYYYSMGVKVAAITSGKIISYKPYSKATGGMSNQCASVMFLGDDGHKFWFGHMKYDSSYSATDRQYKAGDVIGEVGLPQCAISTQSHLHIHMYVNPNQGCSKSNPGNCSHQIIEIVDQLYEALPE